MTSTESMQADYSTVLPFMVKAVLDNRARYARLAEEIGMEALVAKEPKARGYLRTKDGYRLYEHREPLVDKLKTAVRDNEAWLKESLSYPLA
jgi:deoxyhypusine synthase